MTRSATGSRDVEARARALFEVHAGAEAEVVCSAMGRVNLIGDHVDYAGGNVLPMLIAARTVVAAGRATSDQFHTESSVDNAWLRYAKGVLCELRREGIDVPTARIAVASDIAIGAGLASSAALEIAVARAALALTSSTLDARALALLCQRVEHVHAGVPCGIMDQWCIAHAAAGEAIALNCATLEYSRVELPPNLRIEVRDSGQRHALRDGGYAARRAEVEAAARALQIEHLAQLPLARFDEIDHLPTLLARRARHVARESLRVDAAVAALASQDLTRFGTLLTESHASLRDDFDVSTPQLDAIVERVRGEGALGARMTGAGFGGCVVVAWRA